MSNIKKIFIWNENPQKDRTSHIVRIDFNNSTNWTILTIAELLELLRLWIIAEERRYPKSKGFRGRWLLFSKILEVFMNTKSEEDLK